MEEQITYIGVPLTVLGVLPILFNIVKASVIRYRLSKSIPWEIRPFYSISADPANGNVMVYVPPLICAHVNLWPKDMEEDWPLSRSMRFKRWSHKAFHGLILDCRVWLIFKSMTGSEIKTWIKIFMFGLCPCLLISSTRRKRFFARLRGGNRARDTRFWGIRETYALRSSRRNVSKDFSPTNLFSTDRSKYLYTPWMMMALDCGLIIRHSHLEKGIDTRFTVSIDMAIEKRVPLAMKWRDFVLFALAIGIDPNTLDPRQENFLLSSYESNTKIFHGSKVGDDLFLDFLPKYKNNYSVQRVLAWFNIMSIERDDKISCLPLGHETMVQLDGDTFNAYGHGFDPQDCPDPFAAALSWFFYDERVSEKHRPLPVSQRMLEMRDRSLIFLNALERQGILEQLVLSMFKKPLDVDDPTRKDTDEEVNPGLRVLNRLRTEMSRSDHLRSRSTLKIYERLRSLKDRVGNSKGPFMRLKFSEEDIKSLHESCPPALEFFEGYVYCSAEEEERDVLRSLWPHDEIMNLRSSFDPFSKQPAPEKVKLLSSPKNMGNEAHETSELDKMTLLAHILLATSRWGNTARQTWKVNVEFKFLLDKLREAKDREVAGVILPHLFKISEKGIYTAPSDAKMLSGLLGDGESRIVYLF